MAGMRTGIEQSRQNEKVYFHDLSLHHVASIAMEPRLVSLVIRYRTRLQVGIS